MAQIFRREVPVGETKSIQTMVGLNARTEPMAFIRGAFELLDHAILNSTTSFATTLLLDAMARGVDMNRATVEAFMAEYLLNLGHPLQKEYGAKSEEIILGKGGRLMPQKGKWTNEDWKRMNIVRTKNWVGWIRDQMSMRGWTIEFMQEAFSLDLTIMDNIETVPEKADLDQVQKQVVVSSNKTDQRLARVEKGIERIELLLNAMYNACPELFDASLRKRPA